MYVSTLLIKGKITIKLVTISYILLFLKITKKLKGTQKHATCNRTQ